MMTNQQLWIAVGAPIAFNTAALVLTYILLAQRVDALERHLNRRIDDVTAMWTEKLKRVEDILDARLKSLEERWSR